ncbi:hypothetical protein [Legionella brunensis]|uniref:Coiled-coil protein n=1 Tax=Legionella brunensis TaxID=29422 RepID=A0A0W0SNT2_9GAMM|nr:hypothetical protein [Legionella brunensis]KTC84964.1 coiled-coil protein [Legionella brunensis]
MVETGYQKHYKNFLDDKNAFFLALGETKEKLDAEAAPETKRQAQLTLAQQKASTHDYGFVATNRLLIEQEFNQLFMTLKKRGANSDEFAFYCYYCCLMLKQYYEAYENQDKVEDYNRLLRDLRALCIQGKLPVPVVKKESFFTALQNKIAADIKDLLNTPRRLSKLRDRVATSNLNRIYWFFCRTTIKNSLLLARDLKLLEKLGNILGKEVNVDDIVHTLEAPNGVMRFLSVGFFAVRFIMNAGMVLKHTCFPSEEERRLDWKKRFSNEIYKRHATFLNDVVWGTVNCVTNYNEAFGISAPVAGWVVAGFLFFDVCLIMWRRHLEEQEYLTKRSQYRKELEAVKFKLLGELTPAERTILDKRFVMLTEQIDQLELSWKTNNATYLFNATAAFLLMAGFSVSMLLTSPVMVLGCYMVCTFAVAMYLSDGAYKEYKKQSLLLADAKQLASDEEKAILQEYQTARNEFAFTLTKNAVMPALFIATFAVCWQAALVLAVAYLGYEFYRSHSKHTEAQINAVEEDNSFNYTPIY